MTSGKGDADAELHTFVFADIAGFTALTEAHGDLAAADLACEFAEAVKAELPERRGEFIKTIGDAIMLRFDSAQSAVDLSLLLVGELMREHGSPTVRVGVHTGPAVGRSGDWYGAAVNLAARVAAQAGGGEVLISDSARRRVEDPSGLSFISRGLQRLRNVAQPVELFSIAPEDRDTAVQLVTDPVCRMALEPGRAAGQLNYEGQEFWFCSLECARAFTADPDAHLRERGS